MPHTITDITAEGTTLAITIATVVTTIGLVKSIEPPDPEVSIRDVTILTSTSKKKRAGIPDLGKASFKVFYDPNDTVHIALRAKTVTPPSAPDVWTLTYADGMTTTHATDVFSGILTKFHPTGVEVNGTVEADVEIDVTDSLAFTQGT